MATKKRPGVPTIPLDQKFVPVEYNGTTYSLRVELDLNSGSFLKVTEMRYGGAGGSNLVTYPTDAENQINAKPWGGPMSPTGGLGKAGTKLFNEVINSQEAKQAVASELSSLYGTVKPNIQEEWKKSANNAGTNDILSQIVPGSGSFEPNPQQPALTTITPGPGEVIGGPIALPEDIKSLQDTADATIKSLGGDPKSDYPIYFVYPTDAYYKKSQDSVLIEQFEYRAPQADVFAPQGQVNPPGLLQSLQTGLSRGSNIKRTIGGVRLPIPNQLAISNGVSWADDRANALEAGAFFSALGVASKGLTGNIPDAISSVASGVGNITNLIGSGGFSNTPAGILLSSFLAQAALGKIGLNVDPGQFLARATGTTINPNLELLFNGPKLRNFSFAFEFAPNDDTDATETRKIIRFFRQGMAPKKNKNNLIFIGSPNVFRVRYLNGSRRIKGLNSYKICALTACEVNFTPEGVYQSYDDERAVSQPVRTTMTLSFTELTPIFESDYFSEDDPSVVDAALGPFTPDDIGF
jgi:hypothetical protein